MGGSKSPENPEIPSSGLVSIFLGGQGLDSRKICVFDLENPENPGGSGRFGRHHQGTGLHLESGLVGGGLRAASWLRRSERLRDSRDSW